MTYAEFIARFPTAKKTARGVTVNCPAHDDKHPSLDIDPGKDGTILLTCRSKGCSAEQIVAAMGLKMADLFPPVTPAVKPVRVASYRYDDELGNELYVIDRFEPGRHGRKKDFFQRHKENGKYVWKMDGIRRVLYHLPAVLQAGDDHIWICEGEGKADLLNALGFIATTAPGGAAKANENGNSKWIDAYNECLRDKNVVICHDNDSPGQEHAKVLFASLKPVAKTLLFTSAPAPHNDIKDYLPMLPGDDERCRAVMEMLDAARKAPSMEHTKIRNMAMAERSYRKVARDVSAPRLCLSTWLPSLRLRRIIPGEVVTIIGSTSVGKSVIAYNLVLNATRLTSLVFQLELPEALTFERFGSMATGKSGEEIEQAYSRGEEIPWRDCKELERIWWCSESGLSVDRMGELIIESESIIGKRPELVVVDYIQLAKGKGSTAYEQTSNVAEGLRVLAKNLGVILVATSQSSRPMNRAFKADEHSEPDDMRFRPISLQSANRSGSIENSASVVLGAWRSQEDETRMYIAALKGTSGGASLKPLYCRVDPKTLRITELYNHETAMGDATF